MAVTLNTRIVLRNDSSANWLTNEAQVLLKGEVGIEFLADGKVKMKVGDGTKTWGELPYFGGEESHVFEATLQEGETKEAAITRVVGSTTLVKGDVAVVKALISGDKYEYTAYVYNGSAWAAMDGNYDAENVYFADDLTTTAAVGNISLTNGQATIAAAGKNLKDVWNKIFVQEKNPTITQPSVSITFSQAKAYEVGTSVTPSYSATLNAGNYQFGGATGITATAWSVTDTASHTSTEASGSFAAVTVSDSTNYKITATATYGDGTIPKTNVGNNYAAGQIKAGTKSATSGAITGYRNSFYGTMEEKTTVNSATIRALSGKSNKALANGNTFTVSVPVGALRVVIAYPATLRDVTSIKDVNGLNAEIKSGFTKSTVSVEGANSATAIDYKVYTLDFASANDKANTYTVQI